MNQGKTLKKPSLSLKLGIQRGNQTNEISKFGDQVWSRTYALLCSSTNAGVEQLGFHSSVSRHGVELWAFSVRALVVESNICQRIFGIFQKSNCVTT